MVQIHVCRAIRDSKSPYYAKIATAQKPSVLREILEDLQVKSIDTYFRLPLFFCEGLVV